MSLGHPSELRSFVVRALSTELKVPLSTVDAAQSLKEECRMDSIAAANVAFMIEDEYGVELELDQGEEFDSVDAILAIVKKALN